MPTIDTAPTVSSDEAADDGTEADLTSTDRSRERKFSISSQLDESHYAVLPHLFSVDEWDEDDVKRLNDHVRHQLHSKRAKFKRSMRAFRKYVSRREYTECRPLIFMLMRLVALGFFVTLYATLITLFGLIWVLFIIGILHIPVLLSSIHEQNRLVICRRTPIIRDKCG